MTDVLIVGAGPTGLTLACDLTRRGVACRIIEQATAPAAGSRGFTLKPRSLEALDDLGVADRVLAAGDLRGWLRFHLGTEPLFDLRLPPAPADPTRPYPNTVALPQWRTESILRDRLAELGGKVEFGRRLTGFDAGDEGLTATPEDGENVTATLEDGERVRARYLVAADGGRSLVRRTLGLPFSGSTTEDTRALIADVRIDGLDRDNGTHLWVSADGHMLAARPIPHAGTWQVVTSLEPGDEGDLDTLRHALTTRTGRADIQASDPAWLSTWRYNLRMVERYRVGRVLLAGDAAHVHSPFGGHGMNTGIQDAYNLGWKLALVIQGAARAELLDSYEAERLPVAREILADSDRRLKGMVPPRVVRPLVRLILKSVMARQQRRTRHDHPVYRTGPLTRHLTGRRGRVRAGDVAPDAPVRLDGGEHRLSELLRGPHFTALVFGVAPDLADPRVRAYTVVRPGRAGLADTTGHLHRVYGGRKGTTVLIRPDGYVGLMADSPAALTGYLERL
ncbi:FAD-dependent monooxygenase [Nonomuraea guangzhouensis]|uniref:FAD-dependent monooxygenase n=1 Tax=Nonomuraea guangzhouensis TaxID=1291555 RepID=A0ABW4GMV7_9ACTN|nr:FAD-dependent monooxygenase [Nonomuraea guangzhouensis]